MKKITSAVLLLFLAVTLLLESVGLAWMSDNGLSSPIDITSNVHKAYFDGGKGTADEPYLIAAPIQLYYFAWLQYLGYFNIDKDGDKFIDTVYFALKNDIDMHEEDDDGNIIEYVLPPIGTTDNPFLGNFDGCGFTVKNATVENCYSTLIKPPNQTTEENFGGVEIIGFFGVVGSLPEDEDKDKYKYVSTANEVKNLIIENLTVRTQTKQSLIGLVAGYVNGLVDCVGVVGGTVNIEDGVKALSYTANISDYSLIGYCRDEYKDSIYVMDIILKKPGSTDKYDVVPNMTGGNDGKGWGGSVAMETIFDAVQGASDLGSPTYTANHGYIFVRNDVVCLDGEIRSVYHPTSNESIADIDNADTESENEKFGSFIYSQTTQGDMQINFLTGSQKVTLFEYAYNNGSTTPLYYITDGSNHYLSRNGTSITSTNKANASAWYVEDTEKGTLIYTVIGDVIYYLNTSGSNLALTSYLDIEDHNTIPYWKKANDTYFLNGYIIEYKNNAWSLSSLGVVIYNVSSNGTKNYLVRNGTSSVTNSANATNPTLWEVTRNNNGQYTISTLVQNGNNTTRYYLRHSSNRLGFGTTNNNNTWLFDGEQFYYQVNSYFGGTTTTYYLHLNGNSWNLATSESDETKIVMDPGATTVKAYTESSDETGTEIVRSEPVVYVDNSTENGYYGMDGKWVSNNAPGFTYIPLSFEEGSYAVSSGNTGYIVSSKYGDLANGEEDDDGNIRISRYGSSSLGSANAQGNALEPFTMSLKTNGFRTIPDLDKYIAGGQHTEADWYAYLEKLGLQKYAKCYEQFRDSVEGNYCYGLHFMEASVTKNNVAEITATILGETISDYEVPVNSIDFHLYDSGFVNFFAGSYYTAVLPHNNSFFSIYEITRDSTGKKITDIKEIYKIYGKIVDGQIDTSTEYVYTYKGLKEGGTPGQISDYEEIGLENVPFDEGYEEIFDCLWIIHPNEDGTVSGQGVLDYYNQNNTFDYGSASQWENSKTFYFEVPLNKGEYALGSSAGRVGAYLVYLDLAANAQVEERYKEYESFIEDKTAEELPKGVELLSPTDDKTKVDPTDSAFVSINTKDDGTTAVSGNITYSTSDGITVTHSATSGTSAEYIGPNSILKDGEGNTMDIAGVKTTVERTTYRDFNKKTKVTTVTVITATTVGEGESATTSYKRSVVKTDEAGVVIESFEDTKSAPETPEGDNPLSSSYGDDLVKLYFSYGQANKLTIDYVYTPAERDAEGNPTTTPTYEITITYKIADTSDDAKTVNVKAVLAMLESGIDVYINGVKLQEIETVQTFEIVGTVESSGGDVGGEEPAA